MASSSRRDGLSCLPDVGDTGACSDGAATAQAAGRYHPWFVPDGQASSERRPGVAVAAGITIVEDPMSKHSMTALALVAALVPACAWAQAHEPGTGQSGPASSRASNLDGTSTSSPIAPHLPSPDASGGPEDYLRAADQALAARRTGEAQQALELAETRLLDRSTAIGDVAPSGNPQVQALSAALQALGHGDIGAARAATRAAMGAPPAGMAPPPAPGPYAPMAPRYR